MPKKSKAKFRPNPKYDFLNKLEEWKKNPAESNTKAPLINAPGFVNLRKLYLDAEVNFLRLYENDHMLKYNFQGLLTKGELDTCREPETLIDMVPNLHAEKSRLEAHMQENLRIFERLHNVKGDIEKTSAKVLSLKCQQYLDYKKFKVPENILMKYGDMKLPRGQLLFRLLRPRVWFELELLRVKPGQAYVGRILIELYTEAAPFVVREFMRCGAEVQTDRIKFVRLFPNLWIEGEIDLPEDHRLRDRTYEYDMRALDHNTGGIVSFPMEFLDTGFTEGILSFTISSRPLPVLNGNRIAIGRIIDSMKILELLQDYGSKNGKLRKQLKVTSCGAYV